MKIFQSIFFMILSAVGLISCSQESEPKVPPFEIPFDTKKIDETYTFEVNVIEQSNYAIRIRFYINLPNKWSYLLDKKESPEEARKISNILGSARPTESGKWVEPGVPAKFRVQITESKSQEIILDEIIDHPKTSATYLGRYTTLADKILSPGLYTVRVSYVEGNPELTTLYAKIAFGRESHAK